MTTALTRQAAGIPVTHDPTFVQFEGPRTQAVFDLIVDDIALHTRSRRDIRLFEEMIETAKRHGYRISKGPHPKSFSTIFRFDRRPESPRNCELPTRL